MGGPAATCRSPRHCHAARAAVLSVDLERLERIVRAPSVRRAVAGSPLAEDAVQEARIAVWQVMTARPAMPDPYLYAVATKAAVSLLRGRKATGAAERSKMSGSPVRNDSLDELLDNVSFVPPSTAWEDSYALELSVERALAQLEPRDREIVRLRFLEGYTDRATAELMGFSRQLVGKRWAAVRPRLAELLEDV